MCVSFALCILWYYVQKEKKLCYIPFFIYVLLVDKNAINVDVDVQKYSWCTSE